MSTIASCTSFGAGTEGLPNEKSNTFSAPISAALLAPNPANSLIIDFAVPSFMINV